ncbi:hypothetical protein GCM10010405_08700 [Streptomyces macrosporus]|uniref:Uncharacterized protein n=1 Tax=Streptomyces macrosporus TaxID=44032 RepID=A0ABN3JFA5_9ACTN
MRPVLDLQQQHHPQPGAVERRLGDTTRHLRHTARGSHPAHLSFTKEWDQETVEEAEETGARFVPASPATSLDRLAVPPAPQILRINQVTPRQVVRGRCVAAPGRPHAARCPAG